MDDKVKDVSSSSPPSNPTSPSGSDKKVKVKTDIESFEKIALIGKGDVGKVYLVRHKESQKLYAMKVLNKKEMITRNKIKRVMTEREILATSDHPFIVTLYWSFQNSSNLFFVMDYCAGGEFFRILQKQPGKCLPEDHVRFYSAEVLLALEYLHMMGFIYRDLKPENILMHESGHIMLTDFDLSKQAANVTPQVVKKMFSQPDIYSKPELVTNSFVGTAEYIAPEVIQGYGQSSSVDWWTFGILLFEMACGHTPYRGASQDDTFNHILDSDLKFPDNHLYPISSTFKSLVKKLLARDPKKRLGSEHGATDIKKHKFFEGVNFALILNYTPPIKPKISGPLDTSNFRTFTEKQGEDPWSQSKQNLNNSMDSLSLEQSQPTTSNNNVSAHEDENFKEFKPIDRTE